MNDSAAQRATGATLDTARGCRQGLRAHLACAVHRVDDWLQRDQHATYGLAASRVVLGCAVLGLLLSNIHDRQLVWGAAAVWLERGNTDGVYPLVDFVGDLPNWGFDLFYVATLGLSVAFLVGWRTRIVTPALMLCSTAIIEQAPLLGNAGDNLIRVTLILMCFMNTSEHWSLDRRRRSLRQAMGKSSSLCPEWLRNAVHNAVLSALVVNILVIYMAAAMLKLQGHLWQHGTALYYPLQLPEFRPFPVVNDLLTHSGLVVGLMTYLTVLVQLFFAPMLLHPVSRRIALAMMMALHLGIALLMALPWFSLAMISVDLVLVSSATYIALQVHLERLLRRSSSRVRQSPTGRTTS